MCCPYWNQCLNQNTGTRYRITNVRQSGQTLDCAVHQDGVRAVEISPRRFRPMFRRRARMLGARCH
ncbi:UPF0179 family protein [Haloarcula sp. CGMCC 1.6347]|uniref:UPF0179 family protein n=1 Tax=Haloarcula sp. CGMCC 1.6347 TaxID=3111455 RepID=UPI003FA57421